VDKRSLTDVLSPEFSKAITVYPAESTDLKSWSGAQQLILGGGAVSAFVSISDDPIQFLRLDVYDPTHYPWP
jgi:hypothetical protein